jgi:hypothetical protein
MWVICHTLECGLYVRSWNVAICKIWECGLYVRPGNVGYMSYVEKVYLLSFEITFNDVRMYYLIYT